jgi:hypothetical protein
MVRTLVIFALVSGSELVCAQDGTNDSKQPRTSASQQTGIDPPDISTRIEAAYTYYVYDCILHERTITQSDWLNEIRDQKCDACRRGNYCAL